MATRLGSGITAALFALLLILPSTSRAVAVHTFDCKNCHIPSLSVTQLGGGNVCLRCHYDTIDGSDSILSDGTLAYVNSAFNPIDASHALGNNPTYYNASGLGQTSHNWGASDTQPRAGAVAPAPAQFYSRYGSSTGKVTCTRCHNPHASRDNPQLLVLGPGSAEAMCVACHVPFNKGESTNRTGNNTTHPVGIAYPAGNDAYKPAPGNADGSMHTDDGVKLYDGRIVCGTCHQVHFADSNASTADTPGNFAALSTGGGDGKLLRGDGAGCADKSAFCQTCHTYQAHGDMSGEKVGCLVCHSGHAYDATAPNFFMLRKSATTARYNTVNGLNYSSSDVLDPVEKSTWWNDGADDMAEGYCEKCHGDAGTIGTGKGTYHVASAICTDCHRHGETKGAFAASCNACHGMPPAADTSTEPGGLVTKPGTTGSATAGAHVVHATTKQYPCDSCHANSVGSGPTHNDGAPQSVTIGFAPFGGVYPGGTYNGQTGVAYDASRGDTTVSGSGTKSCINVYCHGNYPGSGKNASVGWDSPASAACGSCHGGSNGDSPVSGSHGVHASTGAYNISCAACHKGIVSGAGSYTIADQAKHVNGKVDWAFDVADTRLRGGNERYNITSGTGSPTNGMTPRANSTCDNVYCHSNAQPDGGVGAPDRYGSPLWGDIASGGCGFCHQTGTHGDTGAPIASGSHAAHLAYPLHSSAIHECMICHRYNPNLSGDENGCLNCHTPHNPLEPIPLYTNYVLTNHVDGKVTINFDPRFGAFSSYNGTPSPGDGYANCVDTYCHGNYPGSGKNAAPRWGDASTVACGSCHSASASAPPTSGSHNMHSGLYRIPCTSCHSGIVSGSEPYAIADQQKHVNGKVDWVFNAADIRLQGGAERYNITTGTLSPSDGTLPRAYSTCENLYCHSTVQSGSDGTGSPVYGKPTWGSGSGCDGCHAGTAPHHTNAKGADGSSALVTGSHAAHLKYSFNTAGGTLMNICTLCHAWNNESSGGCGGRCHQGNNDNLANKHVNGKIDIAFYPSFTGGSYNGSGVPRSGFNSCASTYCHSDGTALATATVPANTTPLWGSGSLTCTGCHGFPPAYGNGSPKANSHGSHNQYGCNTCHYTTTSNGTTIAPGSYWGITNHVNKAYTVTPGTGIAFTYSFNTSGGTCTNISCHGNNNAKWGTELGCNGCHGNPPATGAHLAHTDGTGASYGSDSNVSSGSMYRFNCGNCHPLAGSKHGNSIVEIELYDASATGLKQNNPATAGRTGTGTDTVCSNIYCHSTGQDVSARGYAASPAWGGTFNGNRCAGCHGDPPAYANGGAGSASANSHYAIQLSWDRPVEGGHLVGLHFDNIRKDPPDPNVPLFDRGGPAGSGAGHGDPATSTTISCPTCHAGTVTVAGQFSAPGTIFSCQSCHVSPVAGSIANKALHVNGSRDVQFMTGTFRTRAQLQPDPPPWPEPLTGPFTAVIAPLGWTRNNGYKSAPDSHDSVPFNGSYNPADKNCTTACHLNQPAAWGDTSKGCFACHADL